jgi:hypothetical protein
MHSDRSTVTLFHISCGQVLKKTYTVSPDLLDEKSPTLTGHASSGTH